MFPSLLSDLTMQLGLISDTPALDASVLIAHIINKPRTWVMAHPKLTLTTEQQERLDDSLARLEYGEPFPYVLGHWEFFGLDFEVTPDVLIPRPETELLVEKAIAWLQEFPFRRTVADVGTGSAIIAVSIAIHIPDAHILATDISPSAIEVARRNANQFNVENRIEFIECDLLPHSQPLSQWERGTEGGVRGFDLICANLPYIPTGTLHDLPIFGREPTLALDGGPDGLDVIRRFLSLAPEWLSAKGMMLLEVEATRGRQAFKLARDIFPAAKINLLQDLSGQNRVLEIIL